MSEKATSLFIYPVFRKTYRDKVLEEMINRIGSGGRQLNCGEELAESWNFACERGFLYHVIAFRRDKRNRGSCYMQ